MALRTRIAILVFTALFAAAPSLAVASDCAGCCCQQAPCDEAEADRESLERAMACCELEPAAPSSPSLRAIQPPALDAPWFAAPVSPAAASRMPLPALSGRLEPRLPPSRLSVVQRN